MLFKTLKPHLDNYSTLIFDEVLALCGSNLHAAIMLSRFLYWSDVSVESNPEACGWFYKTAKDLSKELGMTRRGYEKARRFLLSLGVLQYRRGDVHGKMHWLVNVEEVARQVFTKVKGMAVPKNMIHTQIDMHNYRLPKWIPIKLWNDYLQARKEAGKPVSKTQKKELRKQLENIRAAGGNVVQAIEWSIINGWHGFYMTSTSKYPASKSEDDGSAASAREYQAQMEAKRKQQEEPPPTKPENRNCEARRQVMEAIRKL